MLSRIIWNSMLFSADGSSVDPKLIDHLKSPSFGAYNFDETIVQTLKKLGFQSPTNIQVIQTTHQTIFVFATTIAFFTHFFTFYWCVLNKPLMCLVPRTPPFQSLWRARTGLWPPRPETGKRWHSYFRWSSEYLTWKIQCQGKIRFVWCSLSHTSAKTVLRCVSIV